MSLRPDDPKLSAWLLGELSAEEAAEVERAVAGDPALKMAFQEMERVQRLLTNTLAPQQASLFPRQRNAILQEARRMDAASRVVSLPVRAKTSVAWFFPIAAAAVLALACWLLVQLPEADPARFAEGGGEAKESKRVPGDASFWPAPSPADASNAHSVAATTATQSMNAHHNFPVLIPRAAVNAVEHPVLPLPVQSGRRSLDWVTNAIRNEKKLPHPHAVRFEEMLNRFSFRPAGTAALAKGVALSAESVPCPWQTGSELILVTLRGAVSDARDVVVAFQPNVSVVRSYRLLGYSRVKGMREATLPTQVEAGSSHSLVIEVAVAKSPSSLGTIQWAVDGQSAPVLDVVRRADEPTSKDVHFAALVAACSRWLSVPASAADKQIVAELIRSHRTSEMSADRADFVRLMEEAMSLATK